ncbi:hypothetical protein [Corallococcus sp. AB038B]|uniref:hypothetical protein n=1 Tax=Corallococcus sp. AB038B TaxID=2316718 RepID=UPI000EBF86ED|nr:hypothetical protein [Corallococcus sp. AB038B]RKH92988.1 hypothetical protein D7Y04_41950 [Corallococcus sp. AB038B]
MSILPSHLELQSHARWCRDYVAQLALEAASRSSGETGEALLSLADVLERQALSVDAPPEDLVLPRPHHFERWARVLLASLALTHAGRYTDGSPVAAGRRASLLALADVLKHP